MDAGTATADREAAARRYDGWFDSGWGARAWPVEAAAVLNPRSAWGRLDRPGRREPYRSGCFLPANHVARLATVEVAR